MKSNFKKKNSKDYTLNRFIFVSLRDIFMKGLEAPSNFTDKQGNIFNSELLFIFSDTVIDLFEKVFLKVRLGSFLKIVKVHPLVERKVYQINNFLFSILDFKPSLALTSFEIRIILSFLLSNRPFKYSQTEQVVPSPSLEKAF